jgi:hypothetical protein
MEQDRDTGPARSSGRKRKPSQRLDDSETSASATSKRRSSSASSRTGRNETSNNRNRSQRTSSFSTEPHINQDRSGARGSMDLGDVAADDALINESMNLGDVAADDALINESIMQLPDDEQLQLASNDELIDESLIGGVDEELRPVAAVARRTRDRARVSRAIPSVSALSLSALCEIVVGM